MQLFEEIKTKLQEMGICLTDPEKQIRYYVDTYRQERRKVVNSEGTGTATDDVYTPRLSWYAEADGFLKNHIVIRSRTDNLPLQNHSNPNDALHEGEVEEPSTVLSSSNIQVSGENNTSGIDSEPGTSSSKKSSSSSSLARKVPTKKIKVSVNPEEEVRDSFLLRLEQIRATVDRTSEQAASEDSLDHFALMISSDLRGLSQSRQRKARREIEDIVMKYEQEEEAEKNGQAHDAENQKEPMINVTYEDGTQRLMSVAEYETCIGPL